MANSLPLLFLDIDGVLLKRRQSGLRDAYTPGSPEGSSSIVSVANSGPECSGKVNGKRAGARQVVVHGKRADSNATPGVSERVLYYVDTWFVAHSVPGGDAEDAIQIKASIAYLLIHEKRVTEVGRGTALGDNGCRLVWYALRQDEEKSGSEAE